GSRTDHHLMARNIFQLGLVGADLKVGPYCRSRDATQRVRRDGADASGRGRVNLRFDAGVPAAADVAVRERARIEIDLVVDVHAVGQDAPGNLAASVQARLGVRGALRG